MDGPTCSSCGVAARDAASLFCSACGAALTDGETTQQDSETRTDGLSDESWRYLSWAGAAVGVVAMVALLAVAVGWLSGPRESNPVSSPLAGDDPPPTTTTQPAKALEAIDVPVTGNVVVRSPRLGGSSRYHQDGTVVVVRLTMDTCVRRDGLLEAAGRIRNDSSLGQAFDYGIHMDFRRSLAGPPLAEVDTVIESLRPGETAEWSVSAASTRVVSLRCDITKLDVSPVDATS